MWALGMAERAFALIMDRATSRRALGIHLPEQGLVQDLIPQSRIEIEQTRLLTLKTAWMIDRMEAKGARTEIAAIKVAVPNVTAAVIDRDTEVYRAKRIDRRYATILFLCLSSGPARRRRTRRGGGLKRSS